MCYLLGMENMLQLETRRLFSVLGALAICVLLVQTLTLPHRFGLSCLFPDSKIVVHEERSIRIEYSLDESSVESNSTVHLQLVEFREGFGVGGKSGQGRKNKGLKRDVKDDVALENDPRPENHSKGDSEETSSVEKVIYPKKNFSKKNATKIDSEKHKPLRLQHGSNIPRNAPLTGNTTVKPMRCNMPPKTVMTISEMNSLLLRRRASAGLLRPQWLSARDKELISARSDIENAPFIKDDRELYAPLFRNVSMFKRSYDLMERRLKVYVYKEGSKPIFHLPILKGLYASEGWFMKLMEGNKQFIVKDPKRAHLFYMPFSTRMLEHALYVRNSHNRTNLAAYLRNYTNILAAKYSFWNRTTGADHFFVACHDWAPYETRHHMERCIKSMCNADVTQGFKIGKDVSLPETYVRSVRNTVRDIGGEPASNRSILAFFAGSMHGYLRPILLSHWKDKDPDMKIFGRMPFGVASKMNYIRHMQTSKYCICAKGYEVNSPRVVEAIFYECVPVIISDNFVPPFFDVLNWNAFSVIVAEKDIPNLKNILLSIPYEKYVSLQLAVKKVQRHFIWHSKPIKYDLFHMTLHSIWYNRVFTIKADKPATKNS